GKQRSRPLEQIVEEAKSLVASGVREITLIAQDTTGYGLDLSSGDRLDVLIGRLSDELPEDAWLRTLYLYPTRLTPQIISAMSSSKQFCRYMDLPLQHISEKVLKSMGRPFQKEKTDELIRLIREKMPDAALRTTFLVGFPGETDADFAELMEFVKEIRFDHVGVFAFSPEEGTKAYEMKPVVPKEIAQERADLIMKVQQEISREKNAARIGQVLEVLCTGVSEESELVLTGRTRFQAPEIDGVTYFGIPDAEVKPGDVVNVKITQALEYDLAGDVII
ncbi:MAG TPA: MiaB/RimO family radical SAM methylthiotransferase, partial [Bacillota bacterium]|nr:MiaB/RimO family radical SAM methylthiotransferase [Bacillota bacterium]